MEIKKVIICGLGALGLTYAYKLKDVCDLRILADANRVERYKKNSPMFNGKEVKLDYITPEDEFTADLIIIATKYGALDEILGYLGKFVGENTIIISLINGLISELKISNAFGSEKVLYSYFIGDSAIREGPMVLQDGIGKIVFGAANSASEERVLALKDFFEKNDIDYAIPEDIKYSMWLKLAVNCCVNQISAIMCITFKEMKNESFKKLSKRIIAEVRAVAEKEGVKGLENLEADVLAAIDNMAEYGRTSMLQDIMAGRKTEVDIFSGDIIRRGMKHGISTPVARTLYGMIKIKEEGFN